MSALHWFVASTLFLLTHVADTQHILRYALNTLPSFRLLAETVAAGVEIAGNW